ncbi:MAG TPA: DUF2334 domain-containing protein [Candidatus Nanoarchaeia archaeon]|nr:DUF2334 domain-containing protein [Candidatus Nanoarchaeia archaeon]
MEFVKIILFSLLFLMLTLFFVRLFSHSELDDVHPDIQCDRELIEMSDVLWVIPNFNNTDISKNVEWTAYIKSTNKKLGMHGVYHSYKEFNEERDENYINNGIKIFEKSFFEKPAIFKAPQLAFNEKNKNLIESSGMKVKGKWNQLTHKVYHCSDTGVFPNWLIRIF